MLPPKVVESFPMLSNIFDLIPSFLCILVDIVKTKYAFLLGLNKTPLGVTGVRGAAAALLVAEG